MTSLASIGVRPAYADNLWKLAQDNDLQKVDILLVYAFKNKYGGLWPDELQWAYAPCTPTKIENQLRWLWRFDILKKCNKIVCTPSVRCISSVTRVNFLGMGVRCTPHKTYVFVTNSGVQQAYGSRTPKTSEEKKLHLQYGRCTPYKISVGLKSGKLDQLREMRRTVGVRRQKREVGLSWTELPPPTVFILY